MKLVNTLGDKGLTVVEARSPNFLSEVEGLLGPANSSVGKDLLPFALLLTNKTAKNIWGFTVIYTFPDKLSGMGTPWKLTQTSAGWGPTRAQFMLGPGDTYLVTPVADLFARKYADGRVLSAPPPDEGLIRYIENFTSNFLGGRVDAQIDSVIFSDGTMIGTDDAGNLGRINHRITAEKDLVSATVPLGGKDLVDYLDSAKRSPQLPDEYFSHRASRAEEFKRVLDTVEEAEFKKILISRRYGHWFEGSDFVKERNSKVCGGKQATCYQASAGTSGSVRCSCLATCLAAGCVTFVATAVFAQVTLFGKGYSISKNITSKQVVDCFAGTLEDDHLVGTGPYASRDV